MAANPEQWAQHELLRIARGCRSIVAFTGAGISTESGIPDYRGPGGVWEKKKPPTIGDFLDNPETRRAYWDRRKSDYPELAGRQPNEGHFALARMERAGVLEAVVTQNIDGLHQRAGNDEARVIELHGTSHRIRCMSCRTSWPAMEVQERLYAGETEPDCLACGGVLRSATVLFGESLDQATLGRAVAAARACDLMLVVGSSLVVNPAARLPMLAKQEGAAVAIINRTSTPLDGIADVLVRGEAGPTLSRLADAIAGPETGRER